MILPEYLSTKFILNAKDYNKDSLTTLNYWIITACNPFSLGQRNNDNKNNHLLLKDMLEKSACIKPIICYSNDCSCEPENSFLVSNISKKDIIYLGIKHKQNAVFFVSKNELYVYSCMNKGKILIGNFLDRIKLSQ